MPAGGIARLEGDHITSARQDYNQLTGQPSVNMDMDITGTHIWKEMTGHAAKDANGAGGYIAVVLDDRVYTSPSVHEEIASGGTKISGSFDVQKAADLANILKSGKLPE